MRVLTPEFYQADTPTVAHNLLGKYLVTNFKNQLTTGKIVETEAYLTQDPASHAFGGLSKRNQSMFGPAGNVYIYRIYGMYICLNAVTSMIGVGEAVLIRALEPMEGIEVMQERRGLTDIKKLASGPGRLTIALGMDINLDGTSLIDGPIKVVEEETERIDPEDIVTTTRIGITKASELPLRFYLKDNPFISRK